MTIVDMTFRRKPAPQSYVEFIGSMRRFVESKGLRWEIGLDRSGGVLDGQDWDLRVLTDSHDRHACRLSRFSVDQVTRSTAIEAGYAVGSLPISGVLDPDVQDFIKAIVAYRCRQALSPRTTRHYALNYRRFFSVTCNAPWELSTENFDRFLALKHSDGKIATSVLNLATTINENLLSRYIPLAPEIPLNAPVLQLDRLHERKDAAKLPDGRALLELTRIVFQETPETHQDHMRFYAMRLLILTGLRLNEILLLPSDCLIIERHIDVVTGVPTGEVGGVSESLYLFYFGEKHPEGTPALLVEERQFIPEKFRIAVVDAVAQASQATAGLRAILAAQHQSREVHTKSDLRRFETTSGRKIDTSELLFLVAFGASNVPDALELGTPIAPIAPASVYASLSQSGGNSTLFSRYGRSDDATFMSVRPHSLRHLMNTEFFRLNVPDTIITHHFGRQSVAQSRTYDHRSLAERLNFVALPTAAKALIEPGSSQELVAKMVVSGAIAMSHLAQSFKSIQAEHGDEVAFQYLSANSDGFHVTPYGFCTNSFSVNPCAKHLKCFDNCRHFAASGLPEHRVSLEQLKERLQVMRATAVAKKGKTLGRQNQIRHADNLLTGVDKALESTALACVFPAGVDNSRQAEDLFE